MTKEQNNLPQIPKGWVWTTLGEIRDNRSQSVVPKRTPNRMFELYSVPSFNSDIPDIVLGKEIGSNKQIVQEETVLLCKINPRINRVWVVGDHTSYPKIASTEWIPFSKIKGISPRYLCYFMKNNRFRNFLASNVSGVGGSLMRINTGTFVHYPFPLPPLSEQNRIVRKIEDLFTRLDVGVKSLQTVKSQLQQYRQAVLKQAFEGKLTEEWRKTHKDEIEPASVLLERIKEERKKSEKGKYRELLPVDTSTLLELPESWIWTKVGEIAEINPKLPKDDIPYDMEVSFLPMKAVEVRTGKFDMSIIKKYSDVKKGYTPFADGDIIFAKITPCMENGKVAIVNNLKNGIGFGSTEFHVVRLIENSCSNEYVFHYILQEHFRREAQRSMTGTVGHLRVPKRYMEDALIPLPPVSEQQQILGKIEHCFSIVDEFEKIAEQSLMQSERLRQSILKKAFEGKLVVQDSADEPAEKLLERIIKERKEFKNQEKESRNSRARARCNEIKSTLT